MNPKLIASLGIDLPEDENVEAANLPVPEPIQPNDLVRVDNPNLPVLEDIEVSLVEGERQLETLIQTGFELIRKMSEENDTIQPNYRNGHLERLTMIFAHTTDAIKFKVKTQLDKKKARLEEQKFIGRGSSGGTTVDEDGTVIVNTTNITNNFSQKDILKMIEETRRLELDKVTDVNFSETVPEPK